MTLDTDDKPAQRDLEDDFELVDPDASCHKCAHYDVCAILNRFAAVAIEGTNVQDPADAPVQPDELAKICDSYAPDAE